MVQMKNPFLLILYSILSSILTEANFREFPYIRPIPCENRMTGEIGVCTFNWSCINVAHGVRIGSCLDRIFVGTCCKIPEDNSRRSTSEFDGSSRQPNAEYIVSRKPNTEYILSRRPSAEYIVSRKPTTEYLDSTRKPSEEYSNSSRKASGEYSSSSKKPSAGNKEQQETIDQNSQVETGISSYDILTSSPEKQKIEKTVSIIAMNNSSVTISPLVHHVQKSTNNSNTFPLSDTAIVSYNTKPTETKWEHTILPSHNRKPILPSEAFHNNPTTSFLPGINNSRSKENTDREDPSFANISEDLKLKATTEIPQKSTMISEVFYQKRPATLYVTHDERKPVAVDPSQDRKPITEDDHNEKEPLAALESYVLGKPVISEQFHDLRKPVVSEVSHNLRRPVSQEASHDLRNPIISEPSHDLRKPSIPEDSHDQRWPVLDEESHDTRLPVLNLFAWPSSFLVSDNQKPIRPDIFDLSLNISQGSSLKVNTNEISITDVDESSSDPSHILFDSESGPQNENINSIYTWATITSSPTIQNISEVFSNTVDKEYTTPNFTLFTEPPYPWPSSKSPSESSQSKQSSEPQGTTAKNISRVCGRVRSSSIMGRIVGGRKSHYLRWPWMISLRRYEGQAFKHKCGAALLNELWAITAAHCVDGKLPNDVMLRLGEYNFHRMDESHPHVERRIYMIVIHPNFDPVTYENDLALLRFYEPVQFRANIIPVCLPKSMNDIAGRMAVVTGWGRLSEEGELPGSLHEVHMPILTNKECEDMYSAAGYSETIRDVFVCAGLLSGGLDACEGDSGGPMVIKGERGQWVLVGLISWGMGCAAPKQPGVYTRITKFADWIHEIIVY